MHHNTVPYYYAAASYCSKIGKMAYDRFFNKASSKTPPLNLVKNAQNCVSLSKYNTFVSSNHDMTLPGTLIYHTCTRGGQERGREHCFPIPANSSIIPLNPCPLPPPLWFMPQPAMLFPASSWRNIVASRPPLPSAIPHSQQWLPQPNSGLLLSIPQ